MNRGRPDLAPTRLSSENFRRVIGHFASGVGVITTRHRERAYGTTASAISSVSLEPPMLLVCMNKSSATGRAIAATRRFAVNILAVGQEELAVRFATKDPDKFDAEQADLGPFGQPVIEGALAILECTVKDEMIGGTHAVLLAGVENAAASQGEPLLYFRGGFGRLTLS